MLKFVFRNKLAALVFVIMTLMSAASMVGSEGKGGLIDFATRQIEGQVASFGQKSARLDQATAAVSPPMFNPDPPQPDLTPQLSGNDGGGQRGNGAAGPVVEPVVVAPPADTPEDGPEPVIPADRYH